MRKLISVTVEERLDGIYVSGHVVRGKNRKKVWEFNKVGMNRTDVIAKVQILEGARLANEQPQGGLT